MRPDIVLLDLGLPGMSGITVIEALRGWTDVPIIVLTARDDERSKVLALDAGADDYVTKPFGMAELVARVRAALRRAPESAADVALVQTTQFELDLAAHRAFVHTDPPASRTEVRLTPTEWGIIGHLVRHPHHLVTYKQLITAVWGPDYEPDQNLLRVHMGHIRRKLEADHAQPRYFITDAGVGYRFQPDDPDRSLPVRAFRAHERPRCEEIVIVRAEAVKEPQSFHAETCRRRRPMVWTDETTRVADSRRSGDVMVDVQEPRRTHLQGRGGLETIQPADRARVPRRRRIVAYVLAIVLPVLTAAAMIPLRVDHGRMAVLVLVIPVVLVALLGGFGPAIVAAACAVLAYDLFLVEPYYDLAISDSDEVVAAVTLFGVALIVGVLNARLVQLRARDPARLDELRHLVAFARVVTEHDDEVSSRRCGHRAHHLGAQPSKCTWQPGRTESTAPILLPDGNLMGRLTAFNPDRATLPEHLEIPVRVDGDLLGRFVLDPTDRHVVSYEERVTAATIAALFGTMAAPPMTEGRS